MSTAPQSTSHGLGRVERRLAELGITLPNVPKPIAAYVATKRVGDLVFVAGQIPGREGVMLASGSVPAQVSIETARACARQCGINALAAIKGEIGDLDKIVSIVKVGCFVACGPEFVDHPKVADGCSEFLLEVLGEAGRHARAAVGAPSLPRGVPVEIDFVVQVRD